MLAALVSAAALAVLAGQDARPPQSNVVQNTANIAAGEVRAGQFTWTHTAGELLRVLESL